jgi:hypothetical protein
MTFHTDYVARMARGRPIPQVTMDQINESNRDNESANPDRTATLEALRANRDRSQPSSTSTTVREASAT